MKNIGSFFDKFKNKAVIRIQTLEIIKETIKKHIKDEIDIKNISISSGNINIKAHNIIKNEIFIKKTSILEDLNKKLDQKFYNIR